MAKKSSGKTYVMVTTTSMYRMRYCVAVEDLQKDDNPLSESSMREYAKDMVVCEDLDEFSQEWIGEQIIDTNVITEDRMLEMFDSDNDYLSRWTKDQKLSWVAETNKLRNNED